MSADEEFDELIGILENPVRRRILRRLSQEPSYPLQLARELGLGQQLVDKHLKSLERAGIVASTFEPSPSGPKRRAYVLKRSLSVSLELGPNLFLRRLFAFDDAPDPSRMSRDASELMRRIEKARKFSGSRRVDAIEDVLRDIDEKIGEMDDERAVMLYLRNLAMSEAAEVICKPEKSVDFRRVFFELMDSHTDDVAAISRALNLRESLVREALKQLERGLSASDF